MIAQFFFFFFSVNSVSNKCKNDSKTIESKKIYLLLLCEKYTIHEIFAKLYILNGGLFLKFLQPMDTFKTKKLKLK